MILFDSGGTLCYDTDYDMLRATEAIMPYAVKNPRGLDAKGLYAAMRAVFAEIRPARLSGVEVSQWAVVRLACARNGVVLDREMDMALFERVFRTALTPVVRTPYVGDLLERLKGAGVRTGVISNSKFSGGSLKERLDRLLPRNGFEFFLSSCDYALCKPRPALFEIALQTAGLPAGDVWYCGDSVENDVAGAAGVGMFPVLYDPDGTAGEGPPASISCV